MNSASSAEIRQSYLDFFKEKQHTIVPSASLLPEAPNLLFTNAGMNQFVPIFLSEISCPYQPGRAADTQKCIRAGGKHNDLEDVGFDTYHHTLFEMLGNWSFGDYFKKEAIEWAWELCVERWGLPAERVYATVYKPGEGDPADFDQEAYDIWEAIFKKAGLDPEVHIVYGNKKDNFWMMGDTGPCGPCSELHIDLTPEGDTKGSLVNRDDARCIEIWNLVFIQFNATPDGQFLPLPAKHVDTGMGFERVCSIIECTKNFTDFKNANISNYNTTVFAPIFEELEKLCGKTYLSTLPERGATPTEQEKIDIAFRVIGDHIRTLTLSIGDGILPGNEGRNYVLRRILRRAVRFGRELGLDDLFFYKLVPVIVDSMGEVFPELKENQTTIEKVIRAEEESFSRTLDRGIELFEKVASDIEEKKEKTFPGEEAFRLYDTYGFPLDLTQLMARERNLAVDEAEFDKLMTEQRERSKAAQKKELIEVSDADNANRLKSEFVGYDNTEKVPVEVCNFEVDLPSEGDEDQTVRARIYMTPTPFYGEMGGQVGDSGSLTFDGGEIEIIDTLHAGPDVWVHITEDVPLLDNISFPLHAHVNPERRHLIESHHSATHILHWALREVLGTTVRQKGSYVGPDRLRFDFSHMEGMKPEELAKVEELVNQRVQENAAVKWEERPYSDVKGDTSIMQLFGEKYGETVRVVDIGGYSKELCAGTHVRQTGDIGPIRIISEGAIAAGVRRLEAICGESLRPYISKEQKELGAQFEQLKSKKPESKLIFAEVSKLDSAEIVDAWGTLLQNRDGFEKLKEEIKEWDKQQAKARQAELLEQASALAPEWAKAADTSGSVPFVIQHIEGADGKFLQAALGELKRHFDGAAFLITDNNGKVALAASVSKEHTQKVKAGDLIKEAGPLVGGRGGGKPEMAQGGGSDASGIPAAIEKVTEILKRV